jgi:MOSC domain-containing protein YiiM
MSGIYFKVLKIGQVKINDELILLEKSKATLTIAEVYASKK